MIKKVNIRFILKLLGFTCIFETSFLIVALLVSLGYGGDDVLPFVYTALIMLCFGGSCFAIGYGAKKQKVGRREGMLLVTLIWFFFSVVGMLPFVFGGYLPTVADAFFETMSGFTTTGATVFKTVEQLPHGILFWRSIIQWQGGIGIIVFTMALLPVITGDAGATSIYNAETTGIMHDRFLPRISAVAKRIALVYLALTTLLVIFLWVGPMNLFDSICHAFTCTATGGYSTKNAGIGYYHSSYVEYIISIFMILCGTNMTLTYFCMIGKPGQLFKDEEFRWFILILFFFVAVTTLYLWFHHFFDTFEGSFRAALFQIGSMMTSTGYLTQDITSWGPFFWVISLVVMFIGGSSGSTSGGFKVSRILVISKNLHNEFKKRSHPNAIVPVRANGIVIPSGLVSQVLAFFFAYLAVSFAAVFFLTLDGVGFKESISSCISCIGNCGPGLGALTFDCASLSSMSKLILCAVMLIGRLEIFTVLCLFSPAFWRN